MNPQISNTEISSEEIVEPLKVKNLNLTKIQEEPRDILKNDTDRKEKDFIMYAEGQKRPYP